MVSVLELINPIYFLPIGAFFIILVGCACYGCYDLFNPAEVTDAFGSSIIACDISDCPIPEIHEQHKVEDKGGGFWSRKAWGLDSSAENSTTNVGGDYSIMMIPAPAFGDLNLTTGGIGIDPSGPDPDPYPDPNANTTSALNANANENDSNMVTGEATENDNAIDNLNLPSSEGGLDMDVAPTAVEIDIDPLMGMDAGAFGAAGGE